MADVQSTQGSYLGSGMASQILSGLAIIVILYLCLAMGEYTYTSFMTMWQNRVELFPDTYASSGRMYTAVQDPSSAHPLTILMSTNQSSGIEFSYSMFINISSATFTSGYQQLYHILHKGYSKPYPLLGPGIFCWGHINTLRVYMNCFDTWNNYTEVPNIPLDKWFHIVVSCKGNKLYVYINGSLKNKQSLSSNTPPYQNYGNVYLFSSRTLILNCNTTPSSVYGADKIVDTVVYPTSNSSLTGNANPAVGTTCASTTYAKAAGALVVGNTPLSFAGAIQGMASRVYYYSYALTYSEIQSLMNMGPSTTMNGPDMTISPYMADTWWTDSQQTA